MKVIQTHNVLKFSVHVRLETPLLLRSGSSGETADSEIQMTPDRTKLFINGDVWASLIRRCCKRISNGLAERIGNYPSPKKAASPTWQGQLQNEGTSPLWAEHSFVDIQDTEIRTGNRINRKTGSTEHGMLFSDELFPPGKTCRIDFNWFLDQTDDPALIYKNLIAALLVIDSPVESIGGGWSYGFGRMKLIKIQWAPLDLTISDNRNRLFLFDHQIEWKTAWPFDAESLESESDQEFYREMQDRLANSFDVIHATAKVADGRLFSISSEILYDTVFGQYTKLPDSFVFRGIRTNGTQREEVVTIPGKAVRQALFSAQLERKLRSLGRDEKNIQRIMTAWFGSTHQRGIIAVLDAPVEHDSQALDAINRISLCEHSFQNVNLFSKEYLKNGQFTVHIVVDAPDICPTLKDEILSLLSEMTPSSSAPPGWYRLGGTSTSTGQICVTQIQVNGKEFHPCKK